MSWTHGPSSVRIPHGQMKTWLPMPEQVMTCLQGFRSIELVHVEDPDLEILRAKRIPLNFVHVSIAHAHAHLVEVYPTVRLVHGAARLMGSGTRASTDPECEIIRTPASIARGGDHGTFD